MTEKLARRGLRIHQEYETDILHQIGVSELMDPKPPVIPASMTIAELAERIARHDPSVGRHQGLFVVDGDGKLQGIITRGDVLRALEEETSGMRTVLEASSRDIVVAYPDETLSEASAKMLSRNIGRLPVVDRVDPRQVIGYLGRQAIMAGRLRRFEEEHVRERGWIDGMKRGGKGNQSLRPA